MFCKSGNQLNNFIGKKVEGIVKKLVDDFNPESIIADGSLGKGEITINKTQENFVMCSDFDLQIVTNKRITGPEMLSYSDEISEIFGFEVNVRRTVPEIFSEESNKDLKYSYKIPSISTYERKYSSKTLYGKDFIRYIPEIDHAKIPIWEGIRLIFNRVGEFLGTAKSVYLDLNSDNDFNISDDGYHKYVYSKNKCVLACMDAILITNHDYHWSLERKVENLKDIMKSRQDNIPALSSEMEKTLYDAVEFKIKGQYTNNQISDSQMVKLVEKTLQFIVNKELNLNLNNWLSFPSSWVKSPKVNSYYYRGPTPSVFYQNGIVIAKILLLRKFFPSWRLFTIPFVCWPHLMYGTLPLLLFTIEPKENKTKYLRVVRRNFSNIASLKAPSSDYWKEWDYLSDIGNKIWYTLALV